MKKKKKIKVWFCVVKVINSSNQVNPSNIEFVSWKFDN
jgi:hypothetical protein